MHHRGVYVALLTVNGQTSLQRLQAGSQDGRLAIYDLAVDDVAPVDTLDVLGLDEPTRAVAFSPGPGPGRWLAAAVGDTVTVYAVRRQLAGGRTGVEVGKNALADLFA